MSNYACLCHPKDPKDILRRKPNHRCGERYVGHAFSPRYSQACLRNKMKARTSGMYGRASSTRKYKLCIVRAEATRVWEAVQKTRSLLANQNAHAVFQTFSQTFSSRSGLTIVLFRASGSPRTITINSSRVRRLQIEIKNNSKSAWNKHVAATFQQYTKAAVTMNHTYQEIPAWKLTRTSLTSGTLKKYIRCENHDRKIHGQCQSNRPF